jgi:outer membrane protein OmpA-like peptidoglycan-associated protein
MAALVGLTLLALAGCTTKNYVRSQTSPLVQKTNELDAETATNSRNLSDLAARSDAGIAQAQSAANQASQNAQAASASATMAQTTAQEAVNRVSSLQGTIANLDNYKALSDVSVLFGFDKSVLTSEGKKQLDELGSQIATAHGYLLEVTGAADSTGSAAYNYQLSERRAQAVVQYLAVKYNVAPHRFYLIGVGKDQATSGQRAKDRRVEIRLLSNTQPQAAANAAPSQGGF